MSKLHNCLWLKVQFSETFSTFNPYDTQICAQIEICLELSLGHCYLKGTTSSNCCNSMETSSGYLPPCCSLISNLPACHRDLQGSHEVCTLFEMALDGNRVIARIKRTCQRRKISNADQLQIFTCTESTISISHH